MAIKYFQKGFNYSQDGPGNRLVYHLQGCNLKCPWCSNPEGMDIGADSLSASVDELFNEAKSCELMFFDNGGVTLTGGEASLQFDEVVCFFRKLKESGISTCIETNGTSNRLPEILRFTDYFICDLKHWNNNTFQSFCGGNLETVKANIFKAAENKKNPLIRIPLIHTFNSSEKDAEEFSRFFKTLNGEFRIELLKYHEFGKDKYQKCNREYTFKDGFVSDEEYNLFFETLKNNGLNLIKT